MYFKQLNLSCIRLLCLFLFFFHCHKTFGQPQFVSFIVESGKVTILNEKIPFSPAPVYSGFEKKEDRVITSVITLNTIIFPSTCGYSNGTVIITASGGTAPYLYTISIGWSQNTGNFPNLSPGTYTFTVSDATGQSTSIPVTVTNAIPGPTLNYVNSTLLTNCTSNDATVTVQGSGGTPPYEYSIDLVNFQTSNVFTNLNQGAYIFSVKDANGCIGTPLSVPIQPLASFTEKI